jgi:hypothetical protein
MLLWIPERGLLSGGSFRRKRVRCLLLYNLGYKKPLNMRKITGLLMRRSYSPPERYAVFPCSVCGGFVNSILVRI